MDNRGLTLLAGVGLGAGLLYLLDPRMGRSRRAFMRDQAYGMWNEAREGWDALSQDVGNRASGLMAEARSRLGGGQGSDPGLCERVRAHLGRAVSHPGAVEVTAQDGRVTLSGPVLADEAPHLLSCVRAVPGVKGVEDRLQVHRQAGNVPALQGGRPRPGQRWELLQDNWSPTTRLLVGLAGGGLLSYGLTQDAPWACALGTLGLGMVAAGLTNRGVRELVPESVRHPFPPGQGGGRAPSRQAEGLTSVAHGTGV